MALDGNGTFTPPAPEFPAIAGTTILASDFNAIILDIAAALSTAIFRDGQAAFTANQSLGTFKLTNVGNGTNPQDATTVLQVFTNPAFTATGATGVTFAGTKLTITVTTADLSGSASVVLPANTTGVTAAVTDNSTLLATTAFVVQQAFLSALPAQSGNAGKFVTTNGTTASWAYAGISTINATVTTSTTLTGSYIYVPVAMTALGQSVTLPDATTLSNGGPQYIIDNTLGGYPVGIRDSAGTLLMAVAAGGEGYVSLKSNATAAGVWSITGTNLEPGLITIDNTFSSTYASTVLKPFVALDDNKSIHFLALASGFAAVVVDKTTGAVGTPVTVSATASMVPRTVFKITSTTAMLFYSSTTGTLIGVVLSLSGATTLAVGTPSSTLTAAGVAVEDFSGAPKIAQLDSTHYLLSYATATGAGTTSVAALEVTAGTTATWGTPVNIIAANNVADSTTTYALTATTGLVAFSNNVTNLHNVVVVSVAGTACTVNTPIALGLNGALTSPPASCLLGPTKVLFCANTTYAQVVTISGVTATAGTALNVDGTGGAILTYTSDSATRYNPHLWPISANSAGLWYLDSSGVSRVVVLSESGGTVTKGTILYRSISQAASNSAGAGAVLPQGTSSFCAVVESLASTAGFGLRLAAHKINGATITVGGGASLANISQVHPLLTIGARLSSGDYILVNGAATFNAASMPVFRSNGGVIDYRGEIKCPLIDFVSGDAAYPNPQAVSSNRVVALGAMRAGTTVGASTYQLRLLSIEIAK